MAMRFRMNLWLATGLALSNAFLAVADGKPAASKPVSSLQPLKALLATPARLVDYAQAKIVIDHFIDPSVDPKAVSRQLDDLVASIKARTPAGASNRTKVEILLATLYRPGPWNGNRPLRYDLNDPFGRTLRNKLLSTYLTTRQGNCVSMPILVLILGQKLGLPVTLATAPEHVLVKYLDVSGEWQNIEATAGGFKYDSSYERELGISAKATQNQIYLRPLTPRESIGVMLSTAMEVAGAKDQQEQRIAIADLALSVNQKDVVAMVQEGAADYLLLQERYVRKYPRPIDIPVALRKDYQTLSEQNLAWYARAGALGWAPPSQTQDASYLQNIEREKTRRKGN
jgi:regulator of sirC expression with transglutaminase-like and TPR domain